MNDSGPRLPCDNCKFLIWTKQMWDRGETWKCQKDVDTTKIKVGSTCDLREDRE